MADKLYNAQSILKDYRQIGEDLWERFRGQKEGTLWYYRSLVAIFNQDHCHPLADELKRTLDSLEDLVAQHA